MSLDIAAVLIESRGIALIFALTSPLASVEE